MSVSGSRVTDEINLDEFERRLRAAGAQQARVEDPLAELARLVEFSHMGIENDAPQAGRGADPAVARAASQPSLEKDALRPTLDDEVEEIAPGASEAERAARQDYAFDAHPPHDASAGEPAGGRRSKRWMVAVSALAIAGVAMIGAVFALRGGLPGLKKDPPFIAAAQGPTKVAPPTDHSVAASSDPGASLLNDSAKPAAVKLVNSEEQPVDLNAQAPALPNAPAAAGASDGTELAAVASTPLAAPVAQPPAAAPDFPTPKPVRTVSLRPDGTPIAPLNSPDETGSAASAASAPAPAPAAPAAPAPVAASDTAGTAQPSTPKLDLPTKLSEKSAARVAVGKTDTTAPEPAAETPRETQNSAKAEKAAKKPKAAEVAEATDASQTPVDATAATTSGGWAVQLAAPRSEAEAKSELARLTSKYGAELNGSAIGVHKAVVKGETIYRLRVVGLTKADAAAMCARLKGEGGQCFIAK